MAFICLYLFIFISYPFLIQSYNPIMKVLSTPVLDKSPVLPLAQLLMTAKLVKDLHQQNGKDKNKYMIFVGKGNIQFQNHELELDNSTETTEFDTTTNSYNDLSNNKHLLKFVSRNGYEVWKRMLRVPQTNDSNSNSNSQNEIHSNEIQTSNSNLNIAKFKPKRREKKYKPLYKPDVQLAESDNGIVEHKVNTPEWFKDVIKNGPKSSVLMDPNLESKPKKPELLGMPVSSDSFKTKRSKKQISVNKRKSIAKNSNPIFEYNKIGRLVIGGFNGLIRKIASLFSQKDKIK